MYVASKQRYGEDLDSFEHATEKHKGLNMHRKTKLCKCAKYALCSEANKREQPMNLREIGVLEGNKTHTVFMTKNGQNQ